MCFRIEAGSRQHLKNESLVQNKEVFEVQQDPLPLHTDTHMQENGCRILLRFSFFAHFSLTIGPNYIPCCCESFIFKQGEYSRTGTRYY